MDIEPEALYTLYKTLYLVEPIDTSSEIKLESNKLLMIFNQDFLPFEKDFLIKILAAINLNIDDTDTKFQLSETDCLSIIQNTNGVIIIFGIELKSYEKYKVIKSGEAQIIIADSIHEIINNVNNKSSLWTCLKEIYKV